MTRPRAPDVLPTTTDPKTLRDLAYMGRRAERSAEAQAKLDRMRRMQTGPEGIKPGNFPMVGGRDYHARPQINENRRPSRRRPSKRLKMRVKRLTKTTE